MLCDKRKPVATPPRRSNLQPARDDFPLDAAEPRLRRFASFAEAGLPLAVARMRRSMMLEASCRAGTSRSMAAIFSHHSAEYFPPMTPPARVSTQDRNTDNRGKIMCLV
jgi:hypothetical protein